MCVGLRIEEVPQKRYLSKYWLNTFYPKNIISVCGIQIIHILLFSFTLAEAHWHEPTLINLKSLTHPPSIPRYRDSFGKVVNRATRTCSLGICGGHISQPRWQRNIVRTSTPMFCHKISFVAIYVLLRVKKVNQQNGSVEKQACKLGRCDSYLRNLKRDFQVDFPCWGPKLFVREQIHVNKSDKSNHPR